MSGDRPSGPPSLTLSALQALGGGELLSPPECRVIPRARSFLNLPYALVPGFRFLRLDLHLPEEASGPCPVVVYASGGAFKFVLKHHGPWKFLPAAGFAVAAIEYRVSGEARYPAALHDVKAAVRWVRANAGRFGLDPDRVAGWGSSAGGHLIALAALTNGQRDFEGDVGEDLGQSSRLASVVDHYGVSDFLTLPQDTNQIPGVLELTGEETSPETLFLGYVPSQRPEAAARASPLSHVSAQAPPFLIMHGDADTRVGIGQSRRLHAALKIAGADSDFVSLPGANHAGPEFDMPEVHARVLEFLNRTLAGEPSPTQDAQPAAVSSGD